VGVGAFKAVLDPSLVVGGPSCPCSNPATPNPPPPRYVDYAWDSLGNLKIVLIVLLVVETICVQARTGLCGGMIGYWVGDSQRALDVSTAGSGGVVAHDWIRRCAHIIAPNPPLSSFHLR
jgi:hypothetical protein